MRWQPEHRGRALVLGVGLEAEHLGAGVAALAGEVLVEAGQLGPAVHHLLGDGGAHPPPTHQQALGHQLADGPAHGRAGQAEPLGQGELVLEGVARAERPRVDGSGELLGELVVERDRARAVDQNRELHCHGLMLAESLIHVTTCKCQNKWLTAVVARFHSGRAAGTPPHVAPERSGTWAPSVWTP